jgi:formamidopyrimidine-DNA glycosylase
MPELPDLTVYVEGLRAKILQQQLLAVRLASPFLLRSVDPPLSAVVEKTVLTIHRLAKRIVVGFEGELFLVFHLMIAGRFRWRDIGAAVPPKLGLAAFDFTSGTLLLTEAGSRKRASLFVVRRGALGEHDPGGIEVLDADLEAFRAALTRENHTLKRALTDPRLFAGIGNAYSDEILHAARLSPMKLTASLAADEIARLHDATQATLQLWIGKLRRDAHGDIPGKVTAFHKEMAVHGRYGQPCRVCGTPIQRIVYADNEANYCPQCQTGGKLLADRALSKLLKDDWPRSLEELEKRKN